MSQQQPPPPPPAQPDINFGMKRPTEYLIEYTDRAEYEKALAREGGDHDAVDPTEGRVSEDAATEEAAIALATQRAKEQQYSVIVLKRRGIWATEDIAWPWDWDDQEWIATANPDGTVEKE